LPYLVNKDEYNKTQIHSTQQIDVEYNTN